MARCWYAGGVRFVPGPSQESEAAANEWRPADFRLFLQAELVERCRKNPRYSLRAFAKFLEIEPSFLSKILSRKRSITKAIFERFSKRLGLSPIQIQNFSDFQSENTRDEEYQIRIDEFEVISDWYYPAILELLQIENFEPSTRAMARALGITQPQLRAAVERLERLGYLEISRNKWRVKIPKTTTLGMGADFSASALRKRQQQILEMAIEALQTIPIQKRQQSSVTLAADPKLLPIAKKLIHDFEQKLTRILRQNGKRSEIYHLSVALYPVTDLKNLENSKRGESES